MISLKTFARYIIEKCFDIVYKRNVAKYIAGMCQDQNTALDIGVGTGFLSKQINIYHPSLKITGIDIDDKTGGDHPVIIYDGNKIPFPDNSFDVVYCIDVLHHTKDILAVIKEIARVSKRYVIIKDHRIYSRFSFYMICFSDYITNAPYNIKCVYNFPNLEEWKFYFSEADLELIEQPENLRYGFFLNERYNPIFKLSKK